MEIARRLAMIATGGRREVITNKDFMVDDGPHITTLDLRSAQMKRIAELEKALYAARESFARIHILGFPCAASITKIDVVLKSQSCAATNE